MQYIALENQMLVNFSKVAPLRRSLAHINAAPSLLSCLLCPLSLLNHQNFFLKNSQPFPAAPVTIKFDSLPHIFPSIRKQMLFKNKMNCMPKDEKTNIRERCFAALPTASTLCLYPRTPSPSCFFSPYLSSWLLFPGFHTILDPFPPLASSSPSCFFFPYFPPWLLCPGFHTNLDPLCFSASSCAFFTWLFSNDTISAYLWARQPSPSRISSFLVTKAPQQSLVFELCYTIHALYTYVLFLKLASFPQHFWRICHQVIKDGTLCF
jgi:hypothetical protein